MKNENKPGRHYVYFGGLLNLKYMYMDLNVDQDYVADSLFCKRGIHVKFGEEMCRDGDKYRAVFCRIRKKDRQAFEEALEEIPVKMSLLGHNDYEDYCRKLMDELDNA